jgi:N-acetylneuraminic acid mutarotase
VWTGSEMIVWGGTAGLFSAVLFNSGGRYNPGADSWVNTNNAPLGRSNHTAVWTGSEMIIWGGNSEEFSALNTGEKYGPATDTWTATSTTGAPDGRSLHTAVWTGSEMIVWGGANPVSYLNTGGRYNPSTDSWVATTKTSTTARAFHTAVWTGSEMIIWGGDDENFMPLNTGGRYNRFTDNWTATSITNVPIGRIYHTAVLSGSEMIVWGGWDNGNGALLNTGGTYDPGTDNWLPTSVVGAPLARYYHTAIWTGNEMIIWGGYDGTNTSDLNTGGKYDPSTDSWAVTSTVNAPDGRDSHTAVWTGSEMIVWGGGRGTNSGPEYFNTGGTYDPEADTWTDTSIINAPSGRVGHTAVWTGSEMIVWGGGPGALVSGGSRYCARSAPTPTPTPCTGRCTPTPRPRPTPPPR